jgi:hypothetical protein
MIVALEGRNCNARVQERLIRCEVLSRITTSFHSVIKLHSSDVKIWSTMILSRPAYLTRSNRQHGGTRGLATASPIMLCDAFARAFHNDLATAALILSRAGSRPQ